MKHFDYEVAINQLKLDKKAKLNNDIRYDFIPEWAKSEDFLKRFLPYLKIVGDSREQDKWLQKACDYYGIAFEWAKKDSKEKTENLKEGDYTFKVVFGNKTYDYTGVVAYERKGSVSEFYNNCVGRKKENGTSDRERVEKEFARFNKKGYRKVVLLLEFGERLIDLTDLSFGYPAKDGKWLVKNVGNTIYSTIMSWKQPNNKGFEIIQSNNHVRLFWLFLQDCYYFFRNEIRNECIKKELIEEI